MNLLEIIIIVLTVVLAFMGYRRGFVRKLVSMLSFVVSIALVSMFLPYMTDFLKNNTPVYEYIVKQCQQVMEQQVMSSLTGENSGTQADAYRNMGRDQIKSLMEQNGYDSSVIDTLSDEQLEQYKEQYIQQYIDQYIGDNTAGQSIQLNRSQQTELIDNLPLPEMFKDMLLDYNNKEGYASLGVSTFQEYIVNFIATVILNVISFIAAVIVVQVFLRVVIAALDILSHIPLIGGLNRLLGLMLGLLQALFFIWIFFLVLSMASTTETGLQLMNMVQSSRLLGYLYDSNLFMQIVIQAAALFV
ncbi:MAG: CvpA family protein [Lachnospiraceae bacterium]|nr:CvpA family protein [Lachnospiraceae bacterium]